MRLKSAVCKFFRSEKHPGAVALDLELVVGHKPIRATFVHGMCFNYSALSVCVAFTSFTFSGSGCA